VKRKLLAPARITRGAPEPFAERVAEFVRGSIFFLVWPYEIEIMNSEKFGEIFCQKHPMKNRRDPFSPKAFCHKRSTRSANGSGEPLAILFDPVLVFFGEVWTGLIRLGISFCYT
jgi:hypothetical protein